MEMVNEMERTVRQEMVRALVMRRITCRFTGRVLDMDTCAVVLDPDGDPMDVADPSVLELLGDAGIKAIEDEGCSIAVAPFAG